MTGLKDAQAAVLRALFAAAPDTAVRDLERGLAEEAMGAGPMAGVYNLIAREALGRRAKLATFEPLIAFCGPGRRFPGGIIRTLWVALNDTNAAETETAASFAAKKRPTDETLAQAAELHDRLCAAAADGLRGDAPAFGAAIACLDAVRPGDSALFARYLDLTPIARAALARMPDWVGRMTEDRAAAVRVAYKDADNLADDAGPRFIEMLAVNLAEPWLIMRILSAVMDHPDERYVAASELAPFAEQVMDDIDQRLSLFRAFDPGGGRPAGLAAGEVIHQASLAIIEFEASVELNREGPWGKRLMQQRQALARLAETRLDQIDKALEAAMPRLMVKFGRGVRGHPKLTDDPNPVALTRAQGLMGFFDCCRQFASQSGYGAARSKAAEKLEGRLDQYVEDLIEMIHAPQPDVDATTLARARVYLDIAAEVMVAAHGEKAGQVIRRRAAAA